MTAEQRFIQLGWEILEHKFRYYICDKPIIQDYDYDRLEKEYDGLAEQLGLPKSASDMVGFKEDRPSCQRVAEKLAYLRGSRKRSKK